MSEVIHETAAETAKKIRKALRGAFPELPARHFSVKSSTYSGGSSVSVRWEDYPSYDEVNVIAQGFSSASFNGMEDIKEYTPYEYEGKRYSGADYILCSRDVTEARYKKAEDIAKIVNDNRYDERSWEFRRLVGRADNDLDRELNYVGNDDNVRLAISEEGQEEVNVVEEGFEEGLKVLETYGIRGTENWHDSRIQEIVEKIKSTEGVKGRLSENGGTTVGTVKEEMIKIIGEYVQDAQVEASGLVETLVTRVMEREINDPNTLADAMDTFYTKEKIEDLKRRVMGIGIGNEKDWIESIINRFVEYNELESVNKDEPTVGEQPIANEAESSEEEITGEGEEVSFTNEDKESVNIIVKNVYGWLETNGFKVDKAKVKTGIKEEELEKIKTTSDTSESLMLGYEKYIFGVCGENIVSVTLTGEDKSEVNKILKRQVSLKANEGKTVDIEQLKANFDTVKIAKMKKVKYEIGFESEVKSYIEELCERYSVQDAATSPVDPNAVVVNGVDIKVVIEALKNGLVTLTFKKADGTLRTMIATRDKKFVDVADEINAEVEVNKQIGTGRIPVWDMQKNEMRAFRMERLTSYTVNGETIEVGVEQSVDTDESVHFDPTTLTTEQMLKVLSKSVVRVVFQKRDGTSRVMWGTRNTDLIEIYQPAGNPMMKRKGEDLTEFDSEQKRQAQIDGNYIRVFDCTVNEFRTFKPSEIFRMDEAHNVASWIEFKPKQDGWYNCINSGVPIKQYYEVGNRKAIDSPERENLERVNLERKLNAENAEIEFTRNAIEKQRLQAEEQKESTLQRSEERKERWALTNEKVKTALATVEEYTEQDEDTYDKMKASVMKLQEKFFELQREGKGRGEIKNVKVHDKSKIVMFGYDDDVYILHPRFIVNGISHKVFADRTNEIKFDEMARRSSGDVELTKELENLSVLVTGRRVRNVLDVVLVEEDIRRMKRFMTLVGQRRESFNREKITVKPQGGSEGVVPHLAITVDGKRFVVSPAVLYSVDRSESLYRRERHTSTLAEFRDAIVSHEQLEISAEAYNVLVNTLTEAYDLRKRIRNEQGIAV